MRKIIPVIIVFIVVAVGVFAFVYFKTHEQKSWVRVIIGLDDSSCAVDRTSAQYQSCILGIQENIESQMGSQLKGVWKFESVPALDAWVKRDAMIKLKSITGVTGFSEQHTSVGL